MKRSVLPVLTYALLLAAATSELDAATLQLNLTNNWITPSFGVADLAGGAGTEFASSTWSSAANAALLTVLNSTRSWTMTVHKVDSAGWAATTLRLFVRRSGNGTAVGGFSLILGGTAFQEVTATATYLFQVIRILGSDRSNIPIQYQIQNISVLLGAATFSTTVYFTVTEN